MSKKIFLTQDKFAIVDDEDFVELSKYKWYAHWDGYNWYALRNITLISGSKAIFKQSTISMHRTIMHPLPGFEIDHRNKNSLNNKKTNLRICTHQQNIQNIRKKKGTSKFKGVRWVKLNHKWGAQIGTNGKTIYLGLFENESKAAKIYDQKAKELFGEFALTNFLSGNFGNSTKTR